MRWTFAIHANSGLYMDAKNAGGAGTPAWLWRRNGDAAQTWVTEFAAQGGFYLHPGYNRWLCLGRNSTQQQAAVLVQSCSGSGNQRWSFGGDNTFYSIYDIRADSGLCIDVQWGNLSAQTPLWLWPCNGGDAQRWIGAPPRVNSASEPVYFISGYSFGGGTPGHNCFDDWGPAVTAMRSWGWTGAAHLVGFYQGDSNCNTQLGSATREYSIRDIAVPIAWHIYNNYTLKRIPVDIMAHSMGGLIARAILTGVARRERHPGGALVFPPYLYVEDVATLGTPHGGLAGTQEFLAWLFGSSSLQTAEMRTGSGFMQWLYDNPQSAQGTDWTLISSGADEVVPTGTEMSAGHKVTYVQFMHNQLPSATSGSYRQGYWNYYDPGVWYTTDNGAAPVRAAWNALYWWNDW
ncbi:ricin-type beta-trefoil lectin domain protein [Dactylosporangium sucinum]|nr:ricin-type beta-trefoil lectin domain protein [Dactylosporangium sucinum]